MTGAVRSLLGMPAVDGERRDLDLLPDRDEALSILADTTQTSMRSSARFQLTPTCRRR